MDKILKPNLITGEIEVEEIEQEASNVVLDFEEPPKTEIELLQEQVKALTLALQNENIDIPNDII